MKPCPFCASTNLKATSRGSYFVLCLDCFARGPAKPDGDPYGMQQPGSGAREAPAVAAWDVRRRKHTPPPKD